MNLEIPKKYIIILLLSIIMIGSLTAGAYYLYIHPVINKIEQKKSELKMENQELSIIQNKLKQAKDQTIQSTMALQQQVPVKRLLDQLLLDIEKAEIISDTNIIEMKLNNSEGDEEIKLPTNTTENSSTANDQNKGNNGSDPKQSTTNKDIALPNGMRQTSISLSGEAKTYFEMEKFLTELKSIKRIIKIEQLKFTGQEEIYSVEQASNPIKFEAVLSAYYYPELVDLQKELPPLDVPKISNKKNPFSEFSDSGLEGNEP